MAMQMIMAVRHTRATGPSQSASNTPVVINRWRRARAQDDVVLGSGVCVGLLALRGRRLRRVARRPLILLRAARVLAARRGSACWALPRRGGFRGARRGSKRDVLIEMRLAITHRITATELIVLNLHQVQAASEATMIAPPTVGSCLAAAVAAIFASSLAAACKLPDGAMMKVAAHCVTVAAACVAAVHHKRAICACTALDLA
jgi:hypothetical protein